MTRLHAIGRFRSHGWFSVWQGIEEGLKHLAATEDIQVWYSDILASSEQEVAAEVEAVKAEVLVFFGGAAPSWVVARAARNNAYIVHWLMDLREHPQPLSGPPGWLDFLAATAAGILPAYREAWGLREEQTAWLPLGCVARAEMPEPIPSYEGKIVFAGQRGNPKVHGRRAEILDAIEAAGLPLVTWNYQGDVKRFKQMAPWMPSIYRGAALCFDWSRSDVAGYTSNRIFDIVGAGGLYFGNWFDGMDALFDFSEILTQPDRGDLSGRSVVDRIRFRIDPEACDQERNQRRRLAAFRRAQAEHTYTHRINRLWNWIEERR